MEIVLLILVVIIFFIAKVLLGRLKQPVSNYVKIATGAILVLLIWFVKGDNLHWKILVTIVILGSFWELGKKGIKENK
jgi:hypothetical protein